jgi:hypothetical protein
VLALQLQKLDLQLLGGYTVLAAKLSTALTFDDESLTATAPAHHLVASSKKHLRDQRTTAATSAERIGEYPQRWRKVREAVGVVGVKKNGQHCG